MYPTFGQIVKVAAGHLGDEGQRAFKNPFLILWARRAYDEMVSVFKMYQLPDALVISAPFVISAAAPSSDQGATISFNPANQAELAGFGEPSLFEERQNLSTDPYTEVKQVGVIPQREQSDKIREYALSDGLIIMKGATVDVQVRMHFYASGNGEALADNATIAVDDCLNFLGAATAAKAGGGKGYAQEAEASKSVAYGANNSNPLAIPGGYLQALIDPKLRVMQQTPCVPPLYRAGMFRR